MPYESAFTLFQNSLRSNCFKPFLIYQKKNNGTLGKGRPKLN